MEVTLLDYFDKTVEQNLEKTAVIDGENYFSFQTVLMRSKLLGQKIYNCSKGALNHPIAVFLPKCIECVLSDIGILYSGNAFMNLDVKNPLPRIQAVLNRVQPLIIISKEKYRPVLESVFCGSVIYLEEINWDVDENNGGQLDIHRKVIIDTDPMCIINTSGSTGTPKGVALNHRSFIDFISWAVDEANIKSDEVMGCLSPVFFDIYCFELCVLMVCGGSMVLIPEGLAAFPAKVLEVLDKLHVNFIFWVPTIMCNIANMGLLDRFKLDSLRNVWFAGEVFPTRQFNLWKRKLKTAKFINLYGPIEITLDCTYYIVDREFGDEEVLPIGVACKNTHVLLLNEEDEQCQIGEEGEICVRGTSLALGYYNDLMRTKKVFVQNPLNHAYPELIYRTGDIGVINNHGEIIFKGRRDTLVKHMGYRIELAEIEHVMINTLRLVKNACVLYDNLQKEIVVYYEGDVIETSDFRKKIAAVLPKYMIPARYIHLDQFPRNANGKTDRLLLKEKYGVGI